MYLQIHILYLLLLKFLIWILFLEKKIKIIAQITFLIKLFKIYIFFI